jgi:hypothetical protein
MHMDLLEKSRALLESSPCTCLQVQLSTYGDSLGHNLKELRHFIDNNLQGVSLSAKQLQLSAESSRDAHSFQHSCLG